MDDLTAQLEAATRSLEEAKASALEKTKEAEGLKYNLDLEQEFMELERAALEISGGTSSKSIAVETTERLQSELDSVSQSAADLAAQNQSLQSQIDDLTLELLQARQALKAAAEVKEDELAATRMAEQKAEATAEARATELEAVRRIAAAMEVELAFMAEKCAKAKAEAEQNALELAAARKAYRESNSTGWVSSPGRKKAVSSQVKSNFPGVDEDVELPSLCRACNWGLVPGSGQCDRCGANQGNTPGSSEGWVDVRKPRETNGTKSHTAAAAEGGTEGTSEPESIFSVDSFLDRFMS